MDMFSRIHSVLLARSKKLTRRRLYEFLQASLYETLSDKSGSRVLNIGSGGKIEDVIRRIGLKYEATITSCDIDSKRKPDVVADIIQMPFDDQSFDCIVCSEVLEHVLYPDQAIKEMKRVLTDQGTLIITTRFIYPLHDQPVDYLRYTKYALVELLSNFESVEVTEHLSYFETIAMLIIRLLKEEQRWVKYFSIPIYGVALLVDFIGKLVGQWLKPSNVTSGYFVVARK